VIDGSRKDIGDGLNAAMRMPGESGKVIFRNIIAEVIEEEERVEIRGSPEPERAAKVHARSLQRWLGLNDSSYGS
jgi:hypothetical protein